MSSVPLKDNGNGLEIAVIGMAGRFPGARNVEELWQNLCSGQEGITFFSDQELREQGVDAETLSDPDYVKAKGVLDEAECFDAAFFGMTPRDATVTDPQQRVFLECAWSALEDAGYGVSSSVRGRVAVFAGESDNSYFFHNLSEHHQLIESVGKLNLKLASDKDFLANRVAYKLDLRGPAVVVQTACSSSLVAIHQSCQSLLSGESDLALAGGVAIRVPLRTGHYYQPQGIASPDGHCRAFDAKANGTVGGDGVGIVVLKRLEDALADRDTIRAVIKGSAINNDGSDKIGYTAPSVYGQADVISSAHRVAEVDPASITYVETHGTGTSLGDPIEIEALTEAFRRGTVERQFCAIGSLKSNIGHLDAAAGVAGFIKTVLALQFRVLPASLHFESPNPNIDFENSPFFVNGKTQPWQVDGPRRAGVSSFGIGGTNAHVILEEAPPYVAVDDSESAPEDIPPQVIVLSARTAHALDEMTANLQIHLGQAHQSFEDIAYSLQVGRALFPFRRTLVCADAHEASLALESNQFESLHSEATGQRVAFMFPGQGAQHAQMSADLYRREPVFREHIDCCADLLSPLLEIDLRELIFANDTPSAGEQLRQTCFAQPALFAVEYALAKTWMHWGVIPCAMIGHSLGEYVAACLAGVFDLKTALRLVSKRGFLMQQMPTGKMLAVSLGKQEVARILTDSLSLAAVNGPLSCVVSGPDHEVDALHRRLTDEGTLCRPLDTSHAFHSQMMTPVVAALDELMAGMSLRPPETPFVSNLSGTWITDAQATDPNYWGRHLRNTVHFSEGLQTLLDGPPLTLLEVGPGQTLSRLAASQIDRHHGAAIVASMRRPSEQDCDVKVLRKAIGRLWAAGSDLDWSKLDERTQRRRVPLPTYPFERQRYWVDPPEHSDRRPRTSALQVNDVEEWFYAPAWIRTTIRRSGFSLTEQQAWLVFVRDQSQDGVLINRLRESRQQVIIVSPSTERAIESPDSFQINCNSIDDHLWLQEQIKTRDIAPEHIVYLWGLADSGRESSELTASSVKQRFHNLLLLGQALSRRRLQPLQLNVVTCGAESVSGVDQVQPDQAILVSLCKVLSQELPGVTCRCIDRHRDLQDQVTATEQILTEITSSSSDMVVAYRGADRWLQTFAPLRIPTIGDQPVRLRQEGVYLVTGGLGNIGLTLSSYLAKTVQAKLVLTTRQAFPPRDDWDRLLADEHTPAPLRSRLKQLKEIEQAGGKTLVVTIAGMTEQNLRDAVAAAETRFGELHGIVHSAGCTDRDAFPSLLELSDSVIEKHFEPKVAGVIALEKVLNGRSIDFCVLMSSLSSVLGGLGFAAYAAANQFMDAFVQRHNQNSRQLWLSIDWDGWFFPNDDAPDQSSRTGRAELAMKPHEGMECFHRLLDWSQSDRVIVSTSDLFGQLQRSLNPHQQEPLQETSSVFEQHPRPNLSTDLVSPRSETEKKLAEIWSEFLGIRPIGVNDNFFELGGDSVLVIQVASKANLCGLNLSPKTLFDHPTVGELASVADLSNLSSQSTSKFGLTSAQQRLLHDFGPSLDRACWSLELKTLRPVDLARLQLALEHVVARHDSLRLRLIEGERPLQRTDTSVSAPKIKYCDFSNLDRAEGSAVVETQRVQAENRLNPVSGPVVQASLLDFGSEEPQRLLLSLHQFVADCHSCNLFLNDLVRAYCDGENYDNEPTSQRLLFRDLAVWATPHSKTEQELPLSAGIRSETSHTSVARQVPESTVEHLSTAAELCVELSMEQTHLLLNEIPDQHRVEAHEVIISALVRTIADWSDRDHVEIEWHPRNPGPDHRAVHRTLGCWADALLININIPPAIDESDFLVLVKDQVRRQPTDDEVSDHMPEQPTSHAELPRKTRFGVLWCGSLNLRDPDTDSLLFEPVGKGWHRTIASTQPDSQYVEIVAGELNGKLRVTWWFQATHVRVENNADLVTRFRDRLVEMIAHCADSSTKRYSASDFPAARLNQSDLDKLAARFKSK